MPGVVQLDERHEALQLHAVALEPNPQGAACGEVFVQELAKNRHAAPPGQAAATKRSASRSTLA